MTENGKFLFLDHTEPTSPSYGEDAHCHSCESSLSTLIAIIRDSGQDPVTQLSGYLITEDPIYLPEGTQARAIARRIGRDRLLETLIELYIRYCPSEAKPD
ncbi:MAG: IreB family regulatory phosphoprotein [Clostridia bacterium]|nr:IreB family regulatory phosphoprotein [Clostridia bacterium]